MSKTLSTVIEYTYYIIMTFLGWKFGTEVLTPIARSFLDSL